MLPLMFIDPDAAPARLTRWREKFAAHCVGTEACKCGRRHVRVDTNRHRHAAAFDGAELFGHYHGVGIVETLSAIFDRLVKAEKA